LHINKATKPYEPDEAVTTGRSIQLSKVTGLWFAKILVVFEIDETGSEFQ
jgi:hypothetical protein